MNSKYFDLLDQWEQAARQGRSLSAEDLCGECHELIDEVRTGIAALAATAWLNQQDDVPENSDLTGNVRGSFPTNLGRYEIRGLIGSGGFGHVLRGYDPELGREVAIKVPRPERLLSTKQFLEEARHLARLKHPGIVAVHDAGRDGELCYIVTDLIQGESLADRIDRSLPNLADSLSIIASLARILDYAHEQGFIHRDIKPGNVLLDSSGSVFLTDFGIAMQMKSETVQGSSVGTLAYMAPEQLGVGTIDHRCDIYSLGVLFYQVMAGTLPFASENPVTLRRQIVEDEPSLQILREQGIPQKIIAICQKCLSKQPTDRYDSGRAVAEAIDLAVTPTLARRLGWTALLAVLIAICSVGAWLYADYQRAWSEIDEPRPELLQNTLDRVQSLKSQTQRSTERSKQYVSEVDIFAYRDNILLTELNLQDAALTDDLFRRLATHPLIRSLDLSGTEITDASAEIFSTFPSLNELILSRTAITDESLRELAMTQVRQLHLSETSISDTGIAYLGDGQRISCQLRFLDLSGTEVTDAAIDHLAKLVNLQELDLERTRFTGEGIERLRSNLPKCSIRASN